MMLKEQTKAAAILGLSIFLGLAIFGFLISKAALQVKSMDRIVTVKGLAEREVAANIAIWPIKFDEAGNDLAGLYQSIETKTNLIEKFLLEKGFTESEITVSQPAILDKQAQSYGNTSNLKYRFTATSVITVYSSQVDLVQTSSRQIVELGKQGIAISGQDYQYRTQYLFTELNSIKPDMIETATKNARKAAEKFAKDSNSKLGKIKNATQGQFSISNRDNSAQHIKKVRVVSTVRYYLSD
jgi:hypothetical protein